MIGRALQLLLAAGLIAMVIGMAPATEIPCKPVEYQIQASMDPAFGEYLETTVWIQCPPGPQQRR